MKTNPNNKNNPKNEDDPERTQKIGKQNIEFEEKK